MAEFAPVERTTVVEHIVEQVKKLVRGNRFGPGSKLPNERELARQLGVSRPSLREALRTLSLMGILDSRPGAGTRFRAAGSDILKVPFEFFVMLEQPSLEHLHETRELIEVFAAGLAAERRTSEDEGQLAAALGALEDAASRPEAWAAANLEFHSAIARAAHNPVLERMMRSLHDGIRLVIEAGRRAVRDDLSSAYRLHEDIFRAIRRGDAGAARAAMKRHMDVSLGNLERSAAPAGGPAAPLRPAVASPGTVDGGRTSRPRPAGRPDPGPSPSRGRIRPAGN